MATSARLAQLASQRRSTAQFSRFQGARHVNGSLSSAVSSIAKKTVTAELADKTNRYNAGEIGNDEMLTYLKGLLGNTALTPQEKVDVQDQIRNFNDKVTVDNLTATYKNSAPGSLQRYQAASAINQYYQSKSQQSEPNTPAQADYLAKAGQWSQAAQSEQDSAQKVARQQKRAALFNQVAQANPNSIEEAQMKAQAYDELAKQAQADGDQTEALQYQTQSQNLINSIPQLQERVQKQQDAGTRKQIVDAINSMANDYHDGRLSAADFAAVIPQLEQAAVGIGDTSIQLSLNKWSDTLAKDAAKGVKRGQFNGLPVVLGKGGAGTGSGGAGTSWDKQDFDYSDNVRLAKAMLDSGKWDAQKYVDVLGKALSERSQQLDDRVQTVYALAQDNPNAKITYNGKKQRAADVYDALTKEQDALTSQVDAYQTGNFAIAEVPPAEFNKSGGLTKTGSSKASFQIVDSRNVPQDQYVQDTEGIYHPIQRKIQKLSPEEAQQASLAGGYYTDNNGNVLGRVEYDSAGNAFVKTSNQYVDVYNPDTNEKVSYDLAPGTKNVPSWSNAVEQQKTKLLKDLQTAKSYQTGQQPGAKPPLTGTPTQPVQQTSPVIANQPRPMRGVPPVRPVQNPVPSAQVPPLQAVAQAPVPAGTGITLPPQTIPSQAQTAIKSPQVSALKLAGTPSPSSLASAQLKSVPLAAPKLITPNVAQQAKPKDTLNPIQYLQAGANKLVSLAKSIWPFKQNNGK